MSPALAGEITQRRPPRPPRPLNNVPATKIACHLHKNAVYLTAHLTDRISRGQLQRRRRQALMR